ncbi:putative lipid II flippase FtsW [Rhodococcus xishaensis]|uniref:Probable peptidoglycan glycosyltransferase FtsW n=1 Tax=Rhodococcus xishaensis TaxID=2487364 RepID=A0A438B419_9NOCA|nr:putative lipid II flippase FtsW [Rhodococcus xishaensis]RVW05649.1 putative lipid II flippase FtsW [Rhodococcus xishaensis]
MRIETERRTGRADRGPRTRIGAWLARPLTSFHLVVTIAMLLTVLGLVMVLSSSSVASVAQDGSAYGTFVSQLIFLAGGLVIFYVALMIPIRVVREWSLPAFAVTVVMLVLVLIPGIGTRSQGTRGWFVIGPFSLQPSELAKIAFSVWGAHLLATRRRDNPSLKEMLTPLVPAAMIVLALIVLQPDYGTAFSLAIILLALLWFAGLPLKIFFAILGAGAVAAVTLAMTAGYRSARVRAFFDPEADPQGSGYQARQAKYALADGSLFGEGLGQSRAKWSYLPNAHNDFIFAIIGEELGFIGAGAVIGLFGLFVYTGLRIARRSVDPFLQLLTATATAWITGQAFINIGYVVGVLPVTGLQLPLVSAGGTSAATTLLMFGLVASAARHEPEAVAALHGGQDGRLSRLLRLPKPAPYIPPRRRGAAVVRKAQSTRVPPGRRERTPRRDPRAVHDEPRKRSPKAGTGRRGGDNRGRRGHDPASERRRETRSRGPRPGERGMRK